MECTGQNQGCQEETHHPTHMFRRLFLDLLLMGWRMCQCHGSNQSSHPPVLVRKPLCNQFIHYHISSRGVFGFNRFKFRNFDVVAIECSFATVYRGSIVTRIHRWSVMIYGSLQAESWCVYHDKKHKWSTPNSICCLAWRNYTHYILMNSLAPEKCDINHKSEISEHVLKIDIMKTSCEISPRFIPQDTYNHESTLVQAISWCRVGKSHYRGQCWPGFIYEITELEGVDIWHYNDVIMGAIASQITSLTIVYSAVYSGIDQRKHQSSASLAFVRGIHRWPVNSPQKGPVKRKMFPFDDVVLGPLLTYYQINHRYLRLFIKTKKKHVWKMSCRKCWAFYSSINVLKYIPKDCCQRGNLHAGNLANCVNKGRP